MTIVAMLGFAGFVLAETGNNQNTGVLLGDNPVVSKTAVQKAASTISTNSVQAVPANDDCSGAIAIPTGAFPYTTAPVNVTDATPQDVDEGISAACGVLNGGTPIDRSVWYKITPTVTGLYTFNSCFSAAAGSTLFDSVTTIFSSADGTCGTLTSLSCNDSGGCSCASGCGGPPGGPFTDQAKSSQFMTAGSTWYIVVANYTGDFIGGVNTDVALNVTFANPPANDTCSAPAPLTLGRITLGTTEGATNDYRTRNPGGAGFQAACQPGVGQINSSANGIDVVYSFTPPSTGRYSFRYVQDDSAAALRGQSPFLYLADTCPAPDPTGVAPPHCVSGANRINTNDPSANGNGNRSEEVYCASLTAGTPYYLYFDDAVTGNPGGVFAIDVSECNAEVEPNGDLASATVFTPGTSGLIEGSAITSGPAADIDFYSLGTPPAGAKIFAGIDAAASNRSDYELRITTDTDTLGYNDNDGTSWIGSEAPVVGGVFATGAPTYVRVNSKAVIAGNEPYRLYARVETGTAQNEVGPDIELTGLLDFGALAGHVTDGGFVKGIMATTDDMDCFQFVAHTGDNIAFFSDNNPDRVGGVITNVWPALATTDRLAPSNTVFFGQVLINNVAPNPGTLEGTFPTVTSQFSNYRARYTGAYMACFTPTSDVTSGNVAPPAEAYPLPWQGSISINGGPVPGPTPADVSVTVSGPAGPLNTGTIFDYTITLTNHDATGVAQSVRMVDTLPSSLNFLSLTVVDGHNAANPSSLGRNTRVFTLPTPGTSDAAIDVLNPAIPAGESIVYTLRVQVANCIGAGVAIDNTASITSYTTDANAANDSSTASLTTAEDGSCVDLVCDSAGCITNACTVQDHCEAGVCLSSPLNCDDNSLCTDDSCNPADNDGQPCIWDSSLLGDLCFDGNDCTTDTCNPLLFCSFPALAAGTACNDFLGCTNADQCNAFGTCIGQSVCDDGLPCTDDFADEANNCVCDNPLSFTGTLCDDGLPCTAGTVCDGVNGDVTGCSGGGATDCNDNDPCTDDSCDSASGCVHTAVVCDDGNACNGVETCDSNAGGCQAGTPVVCTASDQCHVAGTCDSGTGLCSDPAAPDGTTCDDGNAATDGDVCTAGICAGSTCSSTNDPRTKNYYKKLCNNRNAGDQVTDADAVCVGENTSTFAGISTAAQVCQVLTKNQPTKCDKAEGDLMALALNVCHERVCPSDGLTSQCGSSSSVGQSYGLVDAAVSDPGRTQTTCGTASCFANEINTGSGLVNFTPASLPVGGNTIRVIGKDLPGTIDRN